MKRDFQYRKKADSSRMTTFIKKPSTKEGFYAANVHHFFLMPFEFGPGLGFRQAFDE